ncbi:MAG: integrin alpha [Anaerolineae bacterium]|nr:integrin alpha [Anaerolineae bacterium]MDW8098570.1 integrin alpha [Anaerolineae bacterium]
MIRKLMVVLGVLVLAAGVVVADYAPDTSLEGASASFWGEALDDAGGADVAGAGDVNGDGYADFLITAPGRDAGALDAGEVYLFLGRASGWSQDTRLSAASASFRGERAGDAAGNSAAGVGDVNGDGLEDFLIGAPSNDEAGLEAGQAYLFLGRAQGWTSGISLALADASFLGENPGDGAGLDVSPAGDVNGDGLADFLISAPHYNGAAGKVYLILGRSAGWARDVSLANADASFVGEYPGDLAGQSVAAAGDVNGDGLGDFLIGASSNNEASSSAGKVYLILGRTTGWAANVSLARADVSFLGSIRDELVGFPVAGAGDVNGDGLDDFLVGAIGFGDGVNAPEGAGKVYLILGRSGGWGASQSLAAIAAGSFVGEDYYDGAGWSLAGGGDVNGDGRDDFLIGAPDNWEAGEGFGQVYLILGKASGWAQNVSLRGADASFWGERTGSRAGSSLAMVGDVDGDGFDDFMIGAEEDHESDDGAGQAYLLLSAYGTGVASQTQCFAAGDVPRSDFGSTDVQIDFSAGTAGCVTVVKHRERPGDLVNSAAVWWEISTTKTEFVAALTFYYANGEIAGLTEGALQVFWRPDASSPWQALARQSLHPIYNKITVGQVTAFGQYTLAAGAPFAPTSTAPIKIYLPLVRR